MARWMLWVGVGVLVAGMIMLGLALYFDTFATQGLLLYGGVITFSGLVFLAIEGELRIVGALLLVVGIIGTVYGVLASFGLLSGIALGMTLWYIMGSGFFWGPLLIAIGLISLVGARQSRGSPLTS